VCQPLETLAQAEPASADEADGRRRRGNRTRESILQTAADIASVEGLEGLTIGRLADELGMSKSGLFAHFGSKEELQLATVDAARRRFVDHVVKPRHLPRGRERLEALMRDWLTYYRDQVFRGGCFFNTVKAEFDSRPASPVREVVIDDAREFLAFLGREVRKAQEAGDLDATVEAEQIAFELDALGAAANQQFQLMHDAAVFDRAAPRAPVRTRSSLVEVVRDALPGRFGDTVTRGAGPPFDIRAPVRSRRGSGRRGGGRAVSLMPRPG
jgi:AcrR family transcriptional regulator